MSNAPHVRPTIAVGAVIFDDDGAVVLVRRTKAPLAGHWTLPGGSLEAGETLAQATSREVAEETGLVVSVGPLVEVYEHQSSDDESGRFHYVILDYLCHRIGGSMCAGSDAGDVAAIRADDFDAYGVNDATRRVVERARGMAAELHPSGIRLRTGS